MSDGVWKERKGGLVDISEVLSDIRAKRRPWRSAYLILEGVCIREKACINKTTLGFGSFPSLASKTQPYMNIWHGSFGISDEW